MMAVSYILDFMLYFPEDKREYIPAAITCMIFLIAAILTTRLIMKISRYQEEKAKRLEEQIIRDNRDNEK
jgi:Zn-dependent protease with chaperone function